MATVRTADAGRSVPVETHYRRVVTSVFNSITTGASDVLDVTSSAQMLVVRKTANTSAYTVTFQGSLDNVFWNTAATALTEAGIGNAVNTAPWPYLRANVSVITNTAKTASSVAHTDGVATFTCASHGFLAGEYVTIAGAAQAGYNGSVLILTVAGDGNSFTYAVDPATAGTTTGTITANGNLRVFIAE